MAPLFKVESLPGTRESAGRVRIPAGDMTLVKERVGVWRWPKSYLQQPVKDLLLYHKECRWRGHKCLVPMFITMIWIKQLLTSKCFNSTQAGDQVEGAIATEQLRKSPTISLSKPNMSIGPESTTIVRDFQPINPQVGDIIQLYENDGIHVTSGGIAMMVFRYTTKTLH
ncbi:hypothetical protein MAPG_10418 [Magnaporthiopsis poae ATCC 64411]|uniref:Uncharacterized protein n=1 Tax=Magnaporthiopsis poae (strain ATCC 64411 / 73-15) TaxID=644358 RepID=A0A0C4ECJ1_MAGP6|nr:hypothetical protein MAPG_10418 [Magnaporthiopsis poae ATCC 64411]